MSSLFMYFPDEPKNETINNAFSILSSTHETVSSFLNIFNNSVNKKAEEVTEKEQDLLRAILLFATSGIDSMIKQLIRDALPNVIENDEGAKVVFSNYIEKEVFKRDNLNAKLLTSVLISNNPRDILNQQIIMNLTSSSLQSKDELLKVASYFNIPSQNLTNDFILLKQIFDVRNQIAHEMDFDYVNKCRRVRKKEEMIRYTNEILRIAQVFINEVDKKI